MNNGLRVQQPRLLDELAAMVSVESPTADVAATCVMADLVAELGFGWLAAAPDRIVLEGRPHLRWQFGSTCRVLLIGHLDTVWPMGTLARWPFAVDGDRATGPGVFDMKAGLVQMFAALARLPDLDGVCVLLNSDEETGSATSRALIEQTARGARAALVLEPSAGGAVKTARKGLSLYSVEVTGRAAHAGLEPELGVNATIEIAHQIVAVSELSRPAVGTTVTPTTVVSGTTTNTVPAAAMLAVDVRVANATEQDRVETAMRSLAPADSGAIVTVTGGPNRPPFEAARSADLFALAQRVAVERDLGPLGGVAVGGCSDGNFTAGAGVPTLDGLGAVGGGAHAEGEWVSVPAMADRAWLLAGLVGALLEP